MKKKLARLLSVVIFCTLLVAAVFAASRILERKDGPVRMRDFAQHAPEIDVLIVGNSHPLNAIYPMELWNDYGITAYNLSTHNNTFPVDYWVLRSALETCTPKVVLLDIYYINRYWKVARSSDLHTALDSFPLSRTKLQALRDLLLDPSSVTDDGQPYSDYFAEFLFPFAFYHSRWEELTVNDFSPANEQQRGAEMLVNVAEPLAYTLTTESGEESAIGFVYLRKIVEECRARGIEVLLTNVPYPCADPDDQIVANTANAVAQDLGVKYIDFVHMDRIVDYQTDSYDRHSHVNASGARKVTDYIGDVLSRDFELPDHRGDAAFATWHDDYDAYVNFKMQTIQEQEDLRNLLMLLHDKSFSVIVYVPMNCPQYGDAVFRRLLQNIGRQHLFEADANPAAQSAGLLPLAQLEDAAAAGDAYLAVFDRIGQRITEVSGDVQTTLDTAFGALTYRTDDDGAALAIGPQDADHLYALTVLVVDNRTGDVVLNCSFDR